MCRSRRELSNEYLLAKVGVDTAENEPLEVWGKIQFIIHLPPSLRLSLSLSQERRLRNAKNPGAGPHGDWRRSHQLVRQLVRQVGDGLDGLVRPRVRGSGKLYKARSRLYRSQILQVNTRWKALAEIYTMHSFAPLWNRSLISKFSLKITELFAVFFSKISQILPEFC